MPAGSFSFVVQAPKKKNFYLRLLLAFLSLRKPSSLSGLWFWIGPQMGWPTPNTCISSLHLRDFLPTSLYGKKPKKLRMKFQLFYSSGLDKSIFSMNTCIAKFTEAIKWTYFIWYYMMGNYEINMFLHLHKIYLTSRWLLFLIGCRKPKKKKKI